MPGLSRADTFQHILENISEKIGRDRYQGLRVERTDCEDVCVSGYTKCNRYEHVEQAVLSIEWAGAVLPYFRLQNNQYKRSTFNGVGRRRPALFSIIK